MKDSKYDIVRNERIEKRFPEARETKNGEERPSKERIFLLPLIVG